MNTTTLPTTASRSRVVKPSTLPAPSDLRLVCDNFSVAVSVDRSGGYWKCRKVGDEYVPVERLTLAEAYFADTEMFKLLNDGGRGDYTTSSGQLVLRRQILRVLRGAARTDAPPRHVRPAAARATLVGIIRRLGEQGAAKA